MHLSDGTQIDLSAQVAKVKAKTNGVFSFLCVKVP